MTFLRHDGTCASLTVTLLRVYILKIGQHINKDTAEFSLDSPSYVFVFQWPLVCFVCFRPVVSTQQCFADNYSPVKASQP